MKYIFTCRATRVSSLLLLLLLLTAQAAASGSQQSPFAHQGNGMADQPWQFHNAPAEVIAAFKSRWTAIAEELKTTTSEFAGGYTDSAPRRTVLWWAPESGFIYANLYEDIDVLYFSYGKVSVTVSGIILTIEREQRLEGFDEYQRTTPQRWVGAKWRREQFLIPENSLTDFANYAAGLGAYNDFNGPCCEFSRPFLVENTKPDPAVKPSRPVLPKEYEFFLKQPIEATIEYVGRPKIAESYPVKGELYYHLEEKVSLTPVRINAGKNQGVKPGLLFRLVTIPFEKGKYLKITRVGAQFSEGLVVRHVDEGGKESYYDYEAQQPRPHTPVVVGMRVTTSPP